jgi:hypothetical protein
MDNNMRFTLEYIALVAVGLPILAFLWFGITEIKDYWLDKFSK